MNTSQEFCPKCGSLQHMNVTVSQNEEVDSEGNSKTISIKNYQCENCHFTVRSEIVESIEAEEDKQEDEE